MSYNQIFSKYMNNISKSSSRKRNGLSIKIVAIVIASIMLFSSTAVILSYHTPDSRVSSATTAPDLANASTSTVNSQRMPVPAIPVPAPTSTASPYTGSVNLFISFSIAHQSRLSSFLSDLSNPQSSQYHHYITRSQFTDRYSQNETSYMTAENYFTSFGGVHVKSYSDRLGMQVTGPAQQIGSILNTSFVTSGDGVYTATSEPTLPSVIATNVQQVAGLSNSRFNVTYNLNAKSLRTVLPSPSVNTQGFPAPSGSGTSQYIWGSDLQVAYQEQSLLNVTYPTHQVIATILWSGQVNGVNTGPYYPSDISAYFNSTLPSYEPHPKVSGVPVNGAPYPGVSSTHNPNGPSYENTLDLEMVGSMAPGSSIYNVYGPNASYTSIDAAFAYILNPNSSYSQLNNVSVITNSWGGAEYNNTAWYNDLQESQARGITVLASSGDSGDNQNSGKYVGSLVEFPSAMAYNNFGVTAVGGDTLTLNSALGIQNEIAWYISSSDSIDGGPAGSTGGISSVFPEPNWQKSTLANNVIKGAGRGVPDISAIANNTIVFKTLNGSMNTDIMWGTSIASPVVAGMVAEMDAVLNHYNQSNLGYLNPLLYNLGNQQFIPLLSPSKSYSASGPYNSTLPMLPFYEVSTGRNHIYNATYGYDLVTGWGSINAYNLTDFVLNRNFSDKQYALDGVRNDLYVNNLSVYSVGVNSLSNASIQQNFFVADQLGAPIYWIQNEIFIYGSQSAGWTVRYTGSAIYPFYGQYPGQSVTEFNLQPSKTVYMPHYFNMTSWISNVNKPDQQTLEFQVNSQTIALSVPGAAYIIGSHNYNYVWNGKNYSNGPYPGNPYPGGLAPEFGFVGGPSLGVAYFGYLTNATMTPSILPMGASKYIKPVTATFNTSTDQTGEEDGNLQWTPNSNGNWTMSVNNSSTEQGVTSYSGSTYYQQFAEYGLKSGMTWYLNLSNGKSFSSNNILINAYLPNGTYTANVSGPSGYQAYAKQIRFIVSGQEEAFPVNFVPSANLTSVYALSTFDLALNKSSNGTFADFGSQPFSTQYSKKSAMNPVTGYLYIPYVINSTLVVYNTSSGNVVRYLSVGFVPLMALFDNHTNSVYVDGAGSSIAVYNATSLQREPGISISGVGSRISSIQLLNGGDTLVAWGLNGVMVVYNLTLKKVTSQYSLDPFGYLSKNFGIFNGKAIYLNTSGNYVSSLDIGGTGKITNTSIPPSYNALGLVEIGNTGNFIVGGLNQNNNLVYNATTESITSEPYNLSGTVVSAALNLYSNTLYVMSYRGYLNSNLNMTVINLNTGKVITELASPGIAPSILYDAVNQHLYVPSSSTSSLYVYNTTHYYKATFSESGLPSGEPWYVNISGRNSSGPVTGTSYSTYLSSGPHSYSIQTNDKTYHSNGGSLNVGTSPVDIAVMFSKYDYKVVFDNQATLTGGAQWFVNITGGSKSGPVSGSSTSFDLTNGTYSYTLGVSNNIYRSSVNGVNTTTGTFTVNGAKQTVRVNFILVLYQVSLIEKGLPSGTTWYLNSTAQGSTGIHGNSKVMALHNGSFTFSASNVTDYYTNDTPFSVTVSGSSTTYTISYHEYAFINGTINPSASTISLDGKAIQVTNGHFDVKVVPGTYKLEATDSGYSSYYDNFTIGTGHTDTMNITLSPQHVSSPPAKTPAGNNDIIYVVAGVVAVVVIGSGITIGMRKRK